MNLIYIYIYIYIYCICISEAVQVKHELSKRRKESTFQDKYRCYNTECVMTTELYRLMKLMSDMFGTQNVQWSANMDKVEISVDTSVATVDPTTLVC